MTHEELLKEAKQCFMEKEFLGEPNMRRRAWYVALFYLDKAVVNYKEELIKEIEARIKLIEKGVLGFRGEDDFSIEELKNVIELIKK